jgi:hypothetical protein
MEILMRKILLGALFCVLIISSLNAPIKDEWEHDARVTQLLAQFDQRIQESTQALAKIEEALSGAQDTTDYRAVAQLEHKLSAETDALDQLLAEKSYASATASGAR